MNGFMWKRNEQVDWIDFLTIHYLDGFEWIPQPGCK